MGFCLGLLAWMNRYECLHLQYMCENVLRTKTQKPKIRKSGLVSTYIRSYYCYHTDAPKIELIKKLSKNHVSFLNFIYGKASHLEKTFIWSHNHRLERRPRQVPRLCPIDGEPEGGLSRDVCPQVG